MKKFWQFNITENVSVGELMIYGPIASETWWGDEVTPLQFKAELDGLGDITELNLYINSDGGDVFAGQAIYSMLKRHKAKVVVHVDGLAASIASIIAMAGDVVHMPCNAMLMIHNPMTYAAGNSAEFRKIADTLDKIAEGSIAVYKEKTGLSENKLIEWMDAETWFSAKDALKYGFADVIDEEKQIAASADGKFILMNGLKMDLARYKNPPEIKEVKQAEGIAETKEEKEVREAKESKELSEDKEITEEKEKQLQQKHLNEELFLYEKSIQLKQKKYGR
jgi:ATP-dependent Clp protease protease subunit